MHGGYGSMEVVDQQNGQAVRSLHADSQAWGIAKQRVAFAQAAYSICVNGDIGVDLPQSGEGLRRKEGSCAEAVLKPFQSS